jgi:hypothetical protein
LTMFCYQFFSDTRNLSCAHSIRAARWHIFKPKKIGVNFGGPWNGKCRYILWPFGIYYGHSVNSMAIYVEYLMPIWLFRDCLVYFPPVLVDCNTKDLATLHSMLSSVIKQSRSSSCRRKRLLLLINDSPTSIRNRNILIFCHDFRPL